MTFDGNAPRRRGEGRGRSGGFPVESCPGDERPEMCPVDTFQRRTPAPCAGWCLEARAARQRRLGLVLWLGNRGATAWAGALRACPGAGRRDPICLPPNRVRSQKTKKPRNQETKKPGNQETRKPGNQETRKPGNQETKKQSGSLDRLRSFWFQRPDRNTQAALPSNPVRIHRRTAPGDQTPISGPGQNIGSGL